MPQHVGTAIVQSVICSELDGIAPEGNVLAGEYLNHSGGMGREVVFINTVNSGLLLGATDALGRDNERLEVIHHQEKVRREGHRASLAASKNLTSCSQRAEKNRA